MSKFADIANDLLKKAAAEQNFIFFEEIQSKIAEEYPEANPKVIKTHATKMRIRLLKSNPDLTIANNTEEVNTISDTVDEAEPSSITESQKQNLEYIKRFLTIKRWSFETEKEKIAEYQSPDTQIERKKALRKEIVEHYMYLSCQVAMKYRKDYPDLDLINEGMFGIIKGLEKFDTSRGLRFSTYVISWIKQTILNFLMQDDTVRLPSHLHQDKRILEKAHSKLSQTLGRAPTIQELREETGFTEKRISLTIKSCSTIISLEDMTEDEKHQIKDFVGDESINVEAAFERRLVKEILSSYIFELPDVDRFIVLNHLGFNDTGPMTFTEIGEKIGIVNKHKNGEPKPLSRERVRQIYILRMANFRSLKNNSATSMLKTYWEDEL